MKTTKTNNLILRNIIICTTASVLLLVAFILSTLNIFTDYMLFYFIAFTGIFLSYINVVYSESIFKVRSTFSLNQFYANLIITSLVGILIALIYFNIITTRSVNEIKLYFLLDIIIMYFLIKGNVVCKTLTEEVE